ncbi:hypothetical protein SNE40_003341 [Patella caerulea]|uniref:Sphingomyelin phosphodiesterase 4 n=1 Tax=Patella caerulea TaxID=87958 RepID=A0AAN8Q0S5_PATCE
MAVFGGTNLSSVQLQIQNAFSKPLLSRIHETENIIRTTSTKELKNVLPMIVEGIFGFGTEIGWDIDRVSNRYYSEFDSLRYFLSPDGPLLKLINSLQLEPYTYEFSISHLPSGTRQMIEEGIIPAFYANKIQQQPHGFILALSAFEFYMFHFAYALVNPKFTKSTWHEFYDFIYPSLIDDYLSYFMPLDKKHLPSMPHSPPPIRSPVSHYHVSSSHAQSHSPHSSPSVSPLKSPRGLFKSSFTVANQKQHTPSSPVMDQSEAETWRSETMLQIWCEFWLNQNTVSSERQRFPRGTVISSYALHSLNTSHDRDPFYFLYEHFVPTANHVNVVRVLVKYIHYFVNTASQLPYQTTNTSALDEFKKTIIPQILQKKLYSFLKHAFDHWPLDSSFKMVLEIWLSYIQPWRYTDPKHVINKDRNRPEQDNDKKLDDKWYPFIEDNLLFYSVLFQEFLPRVYRIDLTSYSNTLMLYRVTKVFSKANLSVLIERAEKKMCGSSFLSTKNPYLSMTTDLGASYLSMSDGMSSLPSQLVELESPGFQYIPLFGYRTQSMSSAVLDQMMDAKLAAIKRPDISEKNKHKGFFSWLASFFAEDVPYGHTSPEEIKKQQMLLNASVRNICTVFKMPVPLEVQDQTMPTDMSSHDSSIIGESTVPDHIDTETGPQLTPLGRYQVANGLKKFDVLYYGDPDLEPIKSYENAALVRFFYYFCEIINTKFAEDINILYNRTDFLGRMIQTYISPPLSQQDVILSPVSKVKAEHLRQPRLSLRFLAAYKNLIYLGILYLVMNLWFGLGPLGFVVLLLFGTIFYAAFNALVKPRHKKLH